MSATSKAAATLGRRGGASKSEAKGTASRENGAKGGRPVVYRYLVLRTAFHGGGIVSRHRSASAARAAVEAFRRGISCMCGCVGVWDRDTDGVPVACALDASPYSLRG